jgi:predicted Zn-dependent protease
MFSLIRFLPATARFDGLCCAGCLGLAFLAHADAQQSADPNASHSSDKTVQEHAVSVDDVQRMISHGQLSEAEAQLAVLAQQQPEPAGVERMRGMVHYQRNELAAANTAFEKAIAQDSNDLQAVQLRGATLYRLGQPAEAIPLLERANSTIAAANVDGTYVLAASYLDVHRYDDARRLFAEQYKLPDDSAATYLFLGRILLRHNLPTEAEHMTRKAIELQPGLPQAHLLLGQLVLAQFRTEDAIAEFEAERKINPMNGEVYELLGDAYMQAQRYEDAQQALDCAVLLEPNSTGPYILLGQVLLKREDPLTALNYLSRAEHMDPSNHFTHVLLGQTYRALGRKEDSTREYKAAERIQNSEK